MFCRRTDSVPPDFEFRWAVCGDCAWVDPESDLPVLELPEGTYLGSVESVYIEGGHVCDDPCEPNYLARQGPGATPALLPGNRTTPDGPAGGVEPPAGPSGGGGVGASH